MRLFLPTAATVAVLLSMIAATGNAGLVIGGVELEHGIAPTTDSAPRVLEILEAAARDFGEGRMDRCRARLEEARRATPVLPPVDVMLGRMSLLSRAPLPAVAFFNQAAQSEPDNPDVALACAELAIAQQRWPDARLHLERALALPPLAVWPAEQAGRLRSLCRRRMADVCLGQQRYDDALQLLNELASEGERDAELLNKSGIALVHLDDWQSGLASLKEAKALDASLVPPELTVAGILAGRDPQADVDAMLAAALSEYPDDDRVPAEYGAWHLVNDRPDQALTILQPAAIRFTDSFAVQLHAGQALFQLRKFAEAQPHFERAFLIDPANVLAAEQLCLCLLEQPASGKLLRGLRLAEMRFAGRESLPASASAVLAWAHYRNGDPRAGDALLAGRPSSDPIADYLRGRVLQSRHNRDESQAAFKASAGVRNWHLLRADARAQSSRG